MERQNQAILVGLILAISAGCVKTIPSANGTQLQTGFTEVSDWQFDPSKSCFLASNTEGGYAEITYKGPNAILNSENRAYSILLLEGQQILLGSNFGKLYCLQRSTGVELSQITLLPGNETTIVSRLLLVPSGLVVAVVDSSSVVTLSISNSNQMKIKSKGDFSGRVTDLNYLDKENVLIATSNGYGDPPFGSLSVVSLPSMKELKSYRFSSGVSSLDISSLGLICVGTVSGEIYILTRDLKFVNQFKASENSISTVQFAPDGLHLAISQSSMQLYECSNWKLKLELESVGMLERMRWISKGKVAGIDSFRRDCLKIVKLL